MEKDKDPEWLSLPNSRNRSNTDRPHRFG